MDHLIVGQGLAGSLLAWNLIEHGRTVLVVDRDDDVTSSKVAAGLVTPIAGKQFSFPEGIEETLTLAKKTYWEIEEKTGSILFHHTRIARIFHDQNEKAKWEKKTGKPDFEKRVRDFHTDLEIDEDLFLAEHGGLEILRGGWLDLPAFLEAIRQLLLERLAYAIGEVGSDELVVPNGGGVRWRNVAAGNVIFCQGWQGNENRFFRSIPMSNARGDILRIRCPGIGEEKRIINRNGWLLPLGGERFKAGATYDHDFSDASPTREGRLIIEEKIRNIAKAEFEVTGHQSAIRPVINRSNVFMGRHPVSTDVLFFNGFGSKGVLNAPRRAKELADHLVQGTDLDPATDVREHFTF